jgi:hypothetical protein
MDRSPSPPKFRNLENWWLRSTFVVPLWTVWRNSSSKVQRNRNRVRMRWTLRGAHPLLRVRARVLNRQLMQDFERWHPQLAQKVAPQNLAA